MKKHFIYQSLLRKTLMTLFIGVSFFLISPSSTAQLGVYNFNGNGDCPHQNPNVASQPANVIFSTFTNVNGECRNQGDVFEVREMNDNSTIDLNEYHQFTVTASPGYKLTLTSLSLRHKVKDDPSSGSTTWAIRSSLDNFSSNVGSGVVDQSYQLSTATLSPVAFTAISSVVFRLYIINCKDNGTEWTIDDVSLSGMVGPAVVVVVAPANPGDPISNSPQCATTGVTMNFNGTAPAGETWYWQSSPTGTSTANSVSSYTETTPGTHNYYVRSQDNTTSVWSMGAGLVTITVLPDVSTPAFTSGVTSVRCQGAGSVMYAATAANSTGMIYELDAASTAGGNTINPSTGEVTYDAAWTGTSIIKATATGCNGSISETHQVTIASSVVTPVFTLGATSTRCQGAGSVTYTATANAAVITYSLDAASMTAGNTINAATGEVTFDANWVGTSTVTATTTGCNGSLTETQQVTITPRAAMPVFILGANSTKCQGAGSVIYTATSANATGMSYELDASSISAGNTINPSTGEVTYDAAWTGTSIIKATATGCNGSISETHQVTITSPAATPVFASGATSTRCQEAGKVIYDATSLNSTGMTYSLDAASIAGGNTINASTGEVTYNTSWSGTTIITANAAGCNGSATDTHVVTIKPAATTPVYTLGNTSLRCEGAGNITYTATSDNSTGMLYSLDAASVTAGNSIDASTGEVTFVTGWSGMSTVTATATGCNGALSSTHTITNMASVASPSFTLGPVSTRCQGGGNVNYTASATGSTGLSYSLDAASLAAGNTINSSTGRVNYSSAWTGTSVITASATGCNGPATSTHTVTINGTVAAPVFTLGSASSRCQGAGSVIYGATATNASSITYSLNGGSLAGGNTINSATGEVTFVAGWTGVSVINASAIGCGGPLNASHIVTINLPLGNPTFSSGATSTRCQGAATVTYSASASNSSGMTYSLDATSLAGGNTINAANGAVTYAAGWSGTTIITIEAAGCGGPKTASHTVTINPSVVAPVFALGSTSTRCQGPGTTSFSATATNSTSLTYSLNTTSILGGNSINSSTGSVTFLLGWAGSSTITATANGCNGPVTSTHVVTITPTVGTPSFTLGATSTRCQGANTVSYTATSSNNTGITYSLDAASITGGNSIDPSTGAVTYVAGWTGASVITATATGCNGPRTVNHTVTSTMTVATPVFTSGATSTRCQGVASIYYTATATNSTTRTYALDAASLAGGNSIDASTGEVDFVTGWSGTSTITVTAAGCNGPATATHTVTTTPTVGTPAFVLGNSSTRCQAAATVSYAATATASTAITYTLDAASITGGNSINATTGNVSYAAGWSGSSTITATATGCNGPKTRTHVVTVTPIVGNITFALGLESVRTQSAGPVTYTATAPNSTGMTYTLDVASIAAGNTINAATAVVNWAAGWNGTSLITANAAGCNSSSSATHIVTTNASVVQAPLYLSTGQTLDRIDPVSTGIVATLQTGVLSSTGTTNISFTQGQALCSDLTIESQTISVSVYLNIASGSMPANPAISAVIKYGTTNIITFNNPVYNSATKLLTWTGVLGADVIVPSGQSITLQITTAQAGVTFNIDYHSMSKPSRISLLPVSTFVNIVSFNVYNAAYPAGSIISSSNGNTTVYARAVVTNPFGYRDITGLDIGIIYPASSGITACVDSSTCSRTYQSVWTTPATTGMYGLLATARQGYESVITQSSTIPFDVCTVCPPVASRDSATGAGGSPLTVDVLANDYDPNNNINKSTLSIVAQPNNGTGYISNNKVVYLPNGSYEGKDTLTYRICDSTGLCSTARVYFTINSLLVDPCSEATKTHVFFLPFPENEARIALDSSTNNAFPSNNIRTVVSMKMPYPGMVIVWDHWEDGYEANALNPSQTTTKVWGDGNPYNGIVPGYSSDIIPAGGSIVLDNTIPTNPRVIANIFYDGKDKITASGQVTVTQVSGEPSIMPVQCMKTNVSATSDYGTLFTIPAGENYPSQDFRYTSLFVRAAENNTTINIDKDNNGTFETTATIQEGQIYHVNGGVLSGATVTSTHPVGVELHFGGKDGYSSRDVPIFPASWYYHTYFSPVPTTGRAANPADTAVVMLYNNLNRVLTINWSSGIPTSGSINLPAKSVVRFPLAMSQTAAFKFVNPTGESFTAIQICDSYTPGGGGNTGSDYDWAFNLIAQNRLTDFATVAWAPGSLDATRNDNPVWVTPTANTTIYVKYDGNISGTVGSLSPCGMRYDISYPLNALTHRRLLDASDRDQSGLAVFTCDGTKLAAVYGEDPSTAVVGSPSWDVGSTIQPFCKQKLIFANDDYARTLVSQPVTIPILLNDFGFLAVIDPTSVNMTALLQPRHGTVYINANGTILYTPNPGYVGKDTFEYSVCSTPTPVVCDDATVYVDISSCPAPFNENVIGGQVYLDKNKDGVKNDGGTGVAGAEVYLYVDGNNNNTGETNELKDSVTVDNSGMYQFVTYPERFVEDDFVDATGAPTCAGGTDGTSAWLTPWVDAGDGSTGYCQASSNADVDIRYDNGFGYALRLKDASKSATRTVNLSGASYAFLSFSYRRKSSSLAAGENVIVQASSNGVSFGTIFTIAGDGTTDAGYVTIYNQDITAYAGATTYIRFLTSNNLEDGDTVYIGNAKVQFLRYPQYYITKLNTATVPAYHYTIGATQHNLTATASTTCLSPYDFAIAKTTITVSGTLYNDANGLVDNLVNGTAIGTVSGATVYAYLVDTAVGKVILKSTVNSSNGTYSFAGVDVLSNYKVMLSTTSVSVGSAVPAVASSLNANWVNTGDAYGVNNMGGSGVKPGTASCYITVNTGAVNITGVNFGIERLPNSDDKSASYTVNTPGQQYAVPGLTGLDPEDGLLGSGKTYKITTLPSNAKLYYNGLLVTQNQVIPAFNPLLFKIDPDDFVISTTFNYASMDAAGLFDQTPATIQINWVTLLPVVLLDFNGKLNGSKVDLFWKTSSEINSDHFDVERSLDGREYKPFAMVRAKGNSSIESKYAAVDPIPEKGVNYYRLKMVDKDAAFVYSKIVTIQVNSEASLTTRVMPNPFTGKLDIYLTLPRACMVSFNFVDISGKVVYSKKVKGLKGFNWFVVNDLEKLPSAPYILNLVTDDKTFTEKLIKQ